MDRRKRGARKTKKRWRKGWCRKGREKQKKKDLAMLKQCPSNQNQNQNQNQI